ncbi:MAG: DUF87 domain-containing protein, partial [Clostridia bacterium]|nr:DUF87 domain-containing protein [Clostridia bacterium]
MEKESMSELLLMAEREINQFQYSSLSKMDIIRMYDESRSIRAEDVLCLFNISEIVYDDNEAQEEKFSVVFNALHSCGASCIMILECIEGRTDLYLGAVNKQRCENIYYLNIIRDILKTSVSGNLPGSEIREIVSRKEINRIITDVLDSGFDSQCITSVSCVAGSDEGASAVRHGIETLLGAVRESNFSIIVMADPVSGEQIDEVRGSYEALGTNLSALESTSVTVQSGSNYTTSENTSTSISESLSRGLSGTRIHTVSGAYKREKNASERHAETGKNVLKYGAGAVALIGSEGNIGAAYLAMNATEKIFDGIEKKVISGEKKTAALTEKSIAVDLMEQRTGERYNAAPESVTDSSAEQSGWSIGEQKGKSEQIGKGSSVTQIKSTSVQKSTRDMHISELNDKLKRHLRWLCKNKNNGMFNCCTYIISGSASTNLFVAGQYKALIQSYGDSNQPISINTWTKENGIDAIREYLLHMMHPTFASPYHDGTLSTAMLSSSRELSKQMSLPKRSIPGVSVARHAAFGIDVVRKSALSKGALVRLGEVQHMGKTTGQPVLLDLQSLSSHTFISGTNGSGKSNTVFKILEELLRLKLPFMVIEPAKGEYKNVFGNRDDVEVYGTNPKKSRLLNINPFWFNDDVTVHEHVDK